MKKKVIGLGLILIVSLLMFVSCSKVDKKVFSEQKARLNISLTGAVESRGYESELKWTNCLITISNKDVKIEKDIKSYSLNSIPLEIEIKEGEYNVEITAVDKDSKVNENGKDRDKIIFTGKLEKQKIKNGDNKLIIPTELKKSKLLFKTEKATFRDVKSMYAYIKSAGKAAEDKVLLDKDSVIFEITPSIVDIRVEAINSAEQVVKTLKPLSYQIMPDEEKEIKIELKENKLNFVVTIPFLFEVKDINCSYDIKNDIVKMTWKYEGEPGKTPKFRIYKKTKSLFPVFLAETTEMKYIDDQPGNVSPTEYSINVIADGKQSGFTKNLVDCEWRDAYLLAVKNLKGKLINRKVTLSWDHDTAAKYKIAMKKESETSFQAVSEVTEKQAVIDIPDDSNYVFAVTAVKDTAESAARTILISTKLLVVSNESLDPLKTNNTGALPAAVIYPEPKNLELEAYRLNPEIPVEPKLITDSRYRIELSKNISPEMKVGDTKEFNTVNFTTYENEKITATLQYIGTNCEIWVKDTQEIKPEDAKVIGDEFDNKVFPLVTNNFYTPSDVDSNGKVAILCFDIVDGWNGTTKTSYTGGYFYGGDLTNGEDSNQMEVFYMDTFPGMRTKKEQPITLSRVFPTCVHEFQHMVNFNKKALVDKKAKMDSWMNEGLSMAAEQMYLKAPLASRIKYFNASPAIKDGHSLLYWNNSDPNVLSNYALSYLFMQYLRTQMGQGEPVYKELINAEDTNYLAVEKLIKKYIDPNMSFADFITSFRMALIFKEKSGLYGFKGESGFDTVVPQFSTTTGTALRGGGAFYKLISAPFVKAADADPAVKFVGIGW